jgi:hypothetical protein
MPSNGRGVLVWCCKREFKSTERIRLTMHGINAPRPATLNLPRSPPAASASTTACLSGVVPVLIIADVFAGSHCTGAEPAPGDCSTSGHEQGRMRSGHRSAATQRASEHHVRCGWRHTQVRNWRPQQLCRRGACVHSSSCWASTTL